MIIINFFIFKPLNFFLRLIVDLSPFFIGPKVPKIKVQQVKIINNININIYYPKEHNKTLPCIIYYHGGGWILGSLKAYSKILKYICFKTNYIVIGIEYRKAPENKFPIPFNDSYLGYKWVIDNYKSLNINLNKIALVGDSAGGILYVFRNKEINRLDHLRPIALVLIYPLVDMSNKMLVDLKTRKSLINSLGYWIIKYINCQIYKNQTFINADSISYIGKKMEYPKTLVIAAENDPLNQSIKTFIKQIPKEQLKYKVFSNCMHGFINFAGIFRSSKTALDSIIMFGTVKLFTHEERKLMAGLF